MPSEYKDTSPTANDFPIFIRLQTPTMALSADGFRMKLMLRFVVTIRGMIPISPKIATYPTDYRLAFAFSDILYPLTRRLPLQVAFHLIVEIIGLTKFHSFKPTTSGLPFRRGNHGLRSWNIEPTIHTPYLFDPSLPAPLARST
jgi:hypothetical protein